MSRSWLGIAGLVVTPLPLASQPAQTLPPLLPRAEEIALARSAAPAEISRGASVLVLQRGGYVVAEKGTTGVTCYVNRDRTESLEPHCFDDEGSATIVPIQLRRAELREWGWEKDKIEGDIAAGLQSGRFRLPRRPAVSYMMSSGQVLYSPTSGKRVGQWHPHIMIYYPWMTSHDIGLADSTGPANGPTVAEDGEAMSSVMVIVPDFVSPVPVTTTRE
jgi:hypothetical protein